LGWELFVRQQLQASLPTVDLLVHEFLHSQGVMSNDGAKQRESTTVHTQAMLPNGFLQDLGGFSAGWEEHFALVRLHNQTGEMCFVAKSIECFHDFVWFP
jgi:hypothetical protein